MEAQSRGALKASSPRKGRSRSRIVIADDDRRFRDLLASMLSDGFGVDVEAVSDGAKALACLEKEGLPSLLLVDCNMPMVDGLSVLREAKQRHPQLPVVVMSGADNYESALNFGCDEYLMKPFTWKDLHHTVGRWLKHPSELVN